MYELRMIASVVESDDGPWSGIVYSCHGGMFSGWFIQRRKDSLVRQIDGFPDVKTNSFLTLAYTREKKLDMKSLGRCVLGSIGGQSNVICKVHKLPLIYSTDRTKVCYNCNKKEVYTCPCLGCNCCICKQCFDRVPSNEIVEVEMHETGNSRNDCNDNLGSEDDEEGSYHQDGDDEFSDDGDDESSVGSNSQNNPLHDEEPLEEEDLDDFLTRGDLDDLGVDDCCDGGEIPTTDAGECPYEISEENRNEKLSVSGHVLLNQCGSLLTRRKHKLNGSSKHKYFLQRICASTIGISVPLVYPEGMMFPSIFWNSADCHGSLAGAIPSSLLMEKITSRGFASLPQHVRTRMTSSSAATGTDSRYIAFSYDMLTNLSVSHSDTRIVLNRGLTACEDRTGGLGVRGNHDDSALLESIDSKRIVKNLCASQKYHKMDFFLTFTCNQKEHFGTSKLRKWLDSRDWEKHFEGFETLSGFEKVEIKNAFNESLSTLFLRVWQEVCKLFIDYLRKSPSSPYRRVFSIFA